MTEITFLGVGEACDPRHGNTSVLVNTDASSILLDCGFSVPHHYFARCEDGNRLDCLWISHFHGDHFFGVPLMLLRFWEMGRTSPLVIVGQEGVQELVTQAMELAYPGFLARLSYPIRFVVATAGQAMEVAGFRLSGVATLHSQHNLGLVLTVENERIYYSGDGRATDQVREKIAGCILAIHEAFRISDDIENHGSIVSCAKLVQATGVQCMAVVHIERKTRTTQLATIRSILADYPAMLLPEEGDQLIIHNNTIHYSGETR